MAKCLSPPRLDRLLGAVTVHLLGIGLLVSLTPVHMARHGLDVGSVGTLAALYYLGLLAGACCAPALARQWGQSRALRAIMAVAGAVTLSHAQAESFGALAVLRLLSGAALGAFYVGVESLITLHAPTSERATWFSRYVIATTIGLSVGPLFLAIGSGASMFVLAAVWCLIGLAAAPRFQTTVPTESPETPTAEGPPPRRLAAMTGATVSGVCLGVIYGLLPTVTQGFGFDDGLAGLTLTVAVAAGAVVQPPFARLLGRTTPRAGMTLVCLATAGLAVWVAVGSHSPVWWLISAALVGGPAHLLYPAAVALAQHEAAPNHVQPLQARVMICYSAGAVLGPLVGGALSRWTGNPGAPFLLVVAIPLTWAAVFTRTRPALRTIRLRGWHRVATR